MLEPNGPLPPEIYWRRRAAAIVAGIVALALLVWLISSMGGGDESPEADAAAATSSLTSAPPTSSDKPGEKAAGGAASGGGESGSSGPSGSKSSGAESSGAESSGSESSSSESSSANAPVPAGQCPDQSLAIKVSGDKPHYAPGEQPTFTTVVTNIGTAPCDRDLGSGLQQVLVYTLDGSQRLWSNIDCYPQSEPDVRTLEPGEQAVFSVKWSAKTSAPDCLEKPEPQREPIAPGAYTVVGQLGQLRSSPEPFNIG